MQLSVFDKAVFGRLDELSSGDDVSNHLPYLVSLIENSSRQEINKESLHIHTLLNPFDEVNDILKYFALDYGKLLSKTKEEFQGLLSVTVPVQLDRNQIITAFEDRSFFDMMFWLIFELRVLLSGKQATHRMLLFSMEGEVVSLDTLQMLPVALMKCQFNVAKVICFLLDVPLGQLFIHSIICNLPLYLEEILEALVREWNKTSAVKELSVLIRTSRLMAQRVRFHLKTHRVLPDLALQATLLLCDEVQFLTSVFHESDWMQKYFKQQQLLHGQSCHPCATSQNRPILSELRASLLSKLKHVCEVAQQNMNFAGCSELLRLYCGLSGILSLSLCEDEVKQCIQYSYLDPMHCPSSIQQACICFLFSCHGLFKVCNRDDVVEALKTLREIKERRELLLLAAVYCHRADLSAVVRLIRSKIRLQVNIHNESLKNMADVCTKIVFPIESLARTACELTITPQLSVNSEATAFACMYQLLRSNALVIHGVDVSSWIMKQVLACATPIHPLVPAMLEQYAKHSASGGAIQTFSEQHLREIFEHPSTSTTSKLLFLFYILLFNQRHSQTSKHNPSSSREYSSSFLERLPIAALLNVAQQNQVKYGPIYPPLLSALVTLYPQLFSVRRLLECSRGKYGPMQPIQTRLNSSAKINLQDLPPTLFVLKSRLLLEKFRQQSLYCQLEKINEFLGLLPLIFDKHLRDRSVLQMFHEIWMNLYAEAPWNVGPKTLNKLSKRSLVLQHFDFVVDPLEVLRLDNRIFDYPLLFDIVLQVLESYMMASRNFLASQDTEQTPESRSELNTLILAQDSAIAQALLDVCGQRFSDSNKLTSDCVIQELRILICKFLHQQFIENPLLVKLVHFQTYDLSLIPIAVNGIPSIHICFEFLLELLQQPQLGQQIFALRLAAHLAARYPLQKNLETMRRIIFQVHNMDQALSSADFLTELFPSLRLIYTSFPMLKRPVGRFLLDLLQQKYTDQRSAKMQVERELCHLLMNEDVAIT